MHSTENFTASNSGNMTSGGSASSVEQLLISSIRAATSTDAGGSIAAMVVLAVLAAVTNSLLLSILLLRRPLRAHPSNRLVMSLTAVNLLLALLVLPMCAVVSYSQAVTAQLLKNSSQGELPHSSGRDHVSRPGAKTTASSNESFELSNSVTLTEGLITAGGATSGILTERETSVAAEGVRSEALGDVNIDEYFAETTRDLSTPSVVYQTSSRKVNVEDLLPDGSEWYSSVSEDDRYVRLRKRRAVKNLPSLIMEFALVLRNSSLPCDTASSNREQEYLCGINRAIFEKLTNYENLFRTVLKSDYVYDLRWQRKLTLCKQVLINAKSRTKSLDTLRNKQLCVSCFRELNYVLVQLIKNRCKTVLQLSPVLEPKIFALCDHYSAFMSKWTQLLIEVSRDDLANHQLQVDNFLGQPSASLHWGEQPSPVPNAPRVSAPLPGRARVGRAVEEGQVLVLQDQPAPLLASDLLLAKSEAESSVLCILVAFLTNWLMTTSSFSVAVIALDRYLSLTHPLAPSSGVVARERCKLLLFSCWVGGLVVAFPPFVSWGRYRYRSDWGSCGVVWRASPSYASAWLLLVVLLPLALLTACYVRLLRVARNKCRKVNVGTMLGDGQKTSAAPTPAEGEVKKTTSSQALEALKKLSPATVQAKLAERKSSDEGIHSGDSSPLSFTRKSSVSSQDWQLRRSYSNSSQLSPYSKSYVQGSSGSKETDAGESTEGIVRSCSSQILPYTSLLKNSSLSLHYTPKEKNTDATSKARGSFYRPKSLHLEHKLDDTLPKSLSLSKQHHSASELKKIDSKFLHPGIHSNTQQGESNSTLVNAAKKLKTSHMSERTCQLCSPAALETGVSFKSHDDIVRSSVVQKLASSKATREVSVDRPVPRPQSPSRMYPGDLPPRRLPKSGSDCTLAIPASHRKRTGSRCSRTQSLLSWSPSLKVGLSRRSSQRNSWGWESSPGKGLLTVSVVVGVQLVTWLPFCCVVALEMLGPHQDLLVPVGVKWYAGVLLYCACVLQPLVYGLLNRTIRKQTRTLLSYHSRRRVHVPAKCLWLTALYTLLLEKLSGNTADPLKLKVGSGSRRSFQESNIFSASTPPPPRTSAAAMMVPPKQMNSQALCTCSTVTAPEVQMKKDSAETEDISVVPCGFITDVDNQVGENGINSHSEFDVKTKIPISSSPADKSASSQKPSYRDRCHTVSAIMKPRITYKKMMNEPSEKVEKPLEAVSVIELRETPYHKLGINTESRKEKPSFGTAKSSSIFKVPHVPYRGRGYSVGAKLIPSKRNSQAGSLDSDAKHFSIESPSSMQLLETPMKNISLVKHTQSEQDSKERARDPGFFINQKKRSLLIPEVVTIPATPPTFLSTTERCSISPSNFPSSLSCSSPSTYLTGRLSPIRSIASPYASRAHSEEISNIDEPIVHLRRKPKSYHKSLTIDIPRGNGSLNDASCDSHSPRSFDFLLRSPVEDNIEQTARHCERLSPEALHNEDKPQPRYIDCSSDSSYESHSYKGSSNSLSKVRTTDLLEVHLYTDSEVLQSEQNENPVSSVTDCLTGTVEIPPPEETDTETRNQFKESQNKEKSSQISPEARKSTQSRFTRGATVERSSAPPHCDPQAGGRRSSSVPPKKM